MSVKSQHHHLMAFEEAMGFGGAFVDLMHIARQLMDRDVQVTIVHSYDNECWSDPHLAGAHLIRHQRWDIAEHMGLKGQGSRTTRMAAFGLDIAGNQLPLAVRHAAWARMNGVTAIFLNNSLTHNLSGALVARMLGLPLYAYFQGPEHAGKLLPVMRPWLTRGFAVSAYTREQVHNIGIDRDNVDVLYPGVVPPPDVSLAEPRRPDDTQDGPVRVGMVGMLTPWKGQVQFIEALALALREVPTLEGWLIGRSVPGEEPYRDLIEATIDRLGIRQSIRFVEDRSTPETIYPDVDFTVHSSIQPEPFGRVIIEAMGYGRPVVAAFEGGPGESVREGDTGFRADPHDHALVAKRIVQLASDREVRLKMGEAARADVLERFTYPAVLQPLLDRFPV